MRCKHFLFYKTGSHLFIFSLSFRLIKYLKSYRYRYQSRVLLSIGSKRKSKVSYVTSLSLLPVTGSGRAVKDGAVLSRSV